MSNNFIDSKLVCNMNTLKMLERNGFITLHPHTGYKIRGLYSNKTFTCYYIDEYKSRIFKFRGKEYTVEYVDGCFYPYVFELLTNKNINL